MATFSQQISDSNNDVFANLDTGVIDFNGDAELIMGEHPSGGISQRYEGGLRFTGITIPQGATIQAAKIIFTAAGAETGTPTFTIKCEAADDAAAFSDYANFAGRSKTTASASWSPTGLVNNVTVDTSDFTAALQEVINRAGWASGNDIVVFITPPASYDNEWVLMYERTQSSTKAAQLSITYSTAVNYTLTAAQGSFTHTGQAALLKIGRKITSAFGSFALTGQAVLLKLGHTVVSAFGSFALTGQDVLFHRTIGMLADYGSYALTGFATILMKGKTLVANVATYTLTGFDALFHRTIGMLAAYGSFVLTGYDVILTKTRLLIAAVGTYVLSGQDVSFHRTWQNLVAAYGSFALTGQSVLFKVSRGVLSAITGYFTLTGFSARFTNYWRNTDKSATATMNNTTKNASTIRNVDKSNI